MKKSRKTWIDRVAQSVTCRNDSCGSGRKPVLLKRELSMILGMPLVDGMDDRGADVAAGCHAFLNAVLLLLCDKQTPKNIANSDKRSGMVRECGWRRRDVEAG
jgi:hypothetical protein